MAEKTHSLKTAEGSGADALLAEVAFASLEQMIVMRRLAPGQALSEGALAAILKMGRTPVREALQRLRQLGLVETHARRGSFVARADVRLQLELLEVRRPLEELMVRSAASRASGEERANLAHLAGEQQDAAALRDIERYYAANRAVHDAEVAAAHNTMLGHTMLAIQAQSRRFWYQNIEQSDAFAEAATLHGVIVAAIVAARPDEAAKGASTLMSFLEEMTHALLFRAHG